MLESLELDWRSESLLSFFEEVWNRRSLGGEFNSFRFGEKKDRGEEEDETIAAEELRVSMVMKRRE